MFDLYLIADGLAPERLLSSVEDALTAAEAGRVAVQLRAKSLEQRARARLAHEVRACTTRNGIPLLINTDVELAREVGADGVHLPEGADPSRARRALGQRALIGVSRHRAADLREPHLADVDFAVLGPVFDVPGKGPPLGLDEFARAVRQAEVPVLALGGVTAACVPELIAAGASGVAVIRAVLAAERPRDALESLLRALSGARTVKA